MMEPHRDAAPERAFWDAQEWTPSVPRPEDVEACVRPVLDALTPLASCTGAEVHIADVGCGLGLLTIPAALLMPEATVYGIDVSPSALMALMASAGRVGVRNVTPALCDGRTLPPECSTLDGAFSMRTFEHMPWTAVWGYLRAISRAIVPGGVLRFQFVEGESAEIRRHQFPVERVVAAVEGFGMRVRAVEHGLVDPSWVWVTARRPA